MHDKLKEFAQQYKEKNFFHCSTYKVNLAIQLACLKKCTTCLKILINEFPVPEKKIQIDLCLYLLWASKPLETSENYDKILEITKVLLLKFPNLIEEIRTFLKDQHGLINDHKFPKFLNVIRFLHTEIQLEKEYFLGLIPSSSITQEVVDYMMENMGVIINAKFALLYLLSSSYQENPQLTNYISSIIDHKEAMEIVLDELIYRPL